MSSSTKDDLKVIFLSLLFVGSVVFAGAFYDLQMFKFFAPKNEQSKIQSTVPELQTTEVKIKNKWGILYNECSFNIT